MTDAFESAILSKVIAAVRQTASVPDLPVCLDSRFVEDLRLNSSGMVGLAHRIREMFATDLPQEMIARFRTVADLVRHLSRHFFQDVAEFALAEAA
jgi:acyl carrier protein